MMRQTVAASCNGRDCASAAADQSVDDDESDQGDGADQLAAARVQEASLPATKGQPGRRLPPAAQPLMSWRRRRGKRGRTTRMLDQAGLVLPGERAAGRAGRSTQAVRLWLFAVAALIFVMVIVGGATRLTESGLSITEWKPVTGVIPPLSEAGWRAAFDSYKQIPQYAALNPDMTLDGFKAIYAWEWGHRLLARLIGLAFILPALWFWRERRSSRRARPAGPRRDRVPGAGADRRLVDGEFRPRRPHRGRAGPAGAASADRRRDLRDADLRRRRPRAAAPRARRAPASPLPPPRSRR